MNEDDLSRFLDSFESCIENDRFIRVFYDTFLASSAEVRAMFAQTDFTAQRRALRASLYVMVAASARRQTELSSLAELAERHRALRIEPRHYDLWMESLLCAAALCSQQFDDDVARVWRAAFASGIDFMKAEAAG
jgi:hemoglobin-like flavoprotein